MQIDIYTFILFYLLSTKGGHGESHPCEQALKP